MKALFNEFKMNTVEEKIRFLACEQLESSINGLFPHATVLPFGSSVNSFGKRDCDLDMVVTLDEKLSNQKVEKQINSRLMFHAKG
jgi:poly(A) RNA polymerase